MAYPPKSAAERAWMLNARALLESSGLAATTSKFLARVFVNRFGATRETRAALLALIERLPVRE